MVIGLFVVFSPETLQSNVHLGVTPTWSNFIVSIPVAMVAYTGIETISNMAEEAIDPPRHVPRSIMYVVIAVFAIYAFLPSVALSALPVQPATAQQVQDTKTFDCTNQSLKLHEPTSDLACRYANDPVAGLVKNLNLPKTIESGLGLLRRDPRGHDPDHRDQRRDHRGVAADLLDGAAPTATRGAAAHPPALLHAVRRDHALQRGRGRAHDRATPRSSATCTRSERCSRSRSPTHR